MDRWIVGATATASTFTSTTTTTTSMIILPQDGNGTDILEQSWSKSVSIVMQDCVPCFTASTAAGDGIYKMNANGECPHFVS